MQPFFGLLIMILFWQLPLSAQETTLFIQVEGIRNEKGQLVAAVFLSQSDFDQERTFYEKAFDKSHMINGRLILKLGLPAGIYGISILDDEDGDQKMKYNRIGIPREGFGFVNCETKGLRKPGFSDFKTELRQKEEWRQAKMRYIF